MLTNKNKHSIEKEVNKILERLSMQVISLDEARAEMRILGLFGVSKRYCAECDCDITDSKYNFVCEHCRLQT